MKLSSPLRGSILHLGAVDPVEKSGGWECDLRRASGRWPHSRFPVGAAASLPTVGSRRSSPLPPVGCELAVFSLRSRGQGSISLSGFGARPIVGGGAALTATTGCPARRSRRRY